MFNGQSGKAHFFFSNALSQCKFKKLECLMALLFSAWDGKNDL